MRLSVLLAGCFSLSPPNGAYQCGQSDHACPTGQYCNAIDNRCYKSGFEPDFGGNDLLPPPPGDMASSDLSGEDAQIPGMVSATQSSIDFLPSMPLANAHSIATITVTVRDSLGAPLSGKTVMLSASGNQFSLNQPLAPTSAQGTVTATITAGIAETKLITATVDGVQFSAQLTFKAPTASTLEFTPQPPTTMSHNLPPVVVAARDADNYLLETVNAQITIDLLEGAMMPAPAGTLTGSLVQTTSAGSVTFNGLNIGPAAAGYQLRATTPGAPPAYSVLFTITDATVATPTGFTVTANHSSMDISWSAVAGVKQYNIYRYPSQSGPFDQKFTVQSPTTMYTDAFLMHGPWSYKVDAEDAGGLHSLPTAFASAVAERELCVVNSYRTSSGIVPGSGIVILPALTGDGNPGALRALTADKTALYQPRGLAVDLVNQRLFVSNYLTKDAGTMYTTVAVFNRTDTTTAGPVTPIKEIAINHPGGTSPADPVARAVGVAWDPDNGEVDVIDQTGTAVIGYSYANGTPSWAIVGANTLLSGPAAITVRKTSSDSEIYVTNLTSKTVAIFSRNAVVTAAAGDVNHNANVAPIRYITKYTNPQSQLSLNNPNGIFLYLPPAVPPPAIADSFFIANGASGGSVAWFPTDSGGAPPTGTAVVPTGQYFNAAFRVPSALSIDIPSDTLYLLNSNLGAGNGFVHILSTDGVTLKGTLSGAASSLTDPSDIGFCN